MTRTTYSELLRDPRWQKVRLKKLEAADWTCQSCHCGDKTLAVHHKRYIKGRKPWEYELEELAVLCEDCHEDEHVQKEQREQLLARLDFDGPSAIDDFIAFGAGAVDGALSDETSKELLRQVRAKRPYQYHAGMFAANLSWLGVSQKGMARLVEISDLGSVNEAFIGDLLDLLRKHGVELLGSPRQEGEND